MYLAKKFLNYVHIEINIMKFAAKGLLFMVKNDKIDKNNAVNNG